MVPGVKGVCVPPTAFPVPLVEGRMDVDGERLRRDIEANARFGAIESEGRGRTVLAGTEANREAREYLVDRLEAAGLSVRIDPVGNIVGRWVPPGADESAAAVATGSHLDSVPAGGIFDGPLGVYAGLEAVRSLREHDVEVTRPIEVVSFTEEEGSRFGPGLLGSSVATGARSAEAALDRTDEDGTSLREALDAIGFRGEATVDAAAWDAWIELHVEQSARLERAGLPVGIVSDITGITHCQVEITGEANHAGATPMAERTDALAAASEFVLAIEAAANDLVAEGYETAVGTVGRAVVSPNATNVVPGRVELGLDVRAIDYDAMNELVNRAEDSLSALEGERGVETALDREFDLEPSPMGSRVRTAADRAGAAADVGTMSLHSGAAHDSMHVATVTDAGMLFARSKDGVSHNPNEWTEWSDCRAATAVLAGAIAELATA